MKTINLIAPAKVNLYLGIGERQEDGYHNALTVMHALSMHDGVRMTHVGAGEHVTLLEPCDAAQPLREVKVDVDAGSGLQVEATVIWREGIEPLDIPSQDNLACKAVYALAQELGREEDECIRLVIEKHIPHQTGLGGGSADAAAALLGAAHLWGIPADHEAVAHVAQQLGADVRFFLHGGCMLLQGRGDEPVATLAPRRDSVVIIRPEGGVSTAEAYRTFDESPVYPEPAQLEAVRAATEATQVPLFNNLEAPAQKLLPELAEIAQFASQAPGVADVLLCGSGSGTFAVCESHQAAAALSSAAQVKGYWTRTTSFSPIRAALLPQR